MDLQSVKICEARNTLHSTFAAQVENEGLLTLNAPEEARRLIVRSFGAVEGSRQRRRVGEMNEGCRRKGKPSFQAGTKSSSELREDVKGWVKPAGRVARASESCGYNASSGHRKVHMPLLAPLHEQVTRRG